MHRTALLLCVSFSVLASLVRPASALADEVKPNPPPGQTTPQKAPSAVVPPKPKTSLSAEYPSQLPEEARTAADVILEITVAADGSVKDQKLWKGEPPFSDAALKAAPSWSFEPATRDGKPVNARIRVLIHFTPPVFQPLPETSPESSPGSQTPNTSRGTTVTPMTQAPIEILAIGERRPLGITTMGRAEVRVLPGAFGDPFRAIESLPGVTPIISGLPFFFIRGAPPGNVGYFLDNIRVPYLYHLALGPSVVNPAIVDRVDLYPGGYPAQFGRFAGGIVSGETTLPEDHLHGEAQIRFFDAGALVEAPLGDKGAVLAGGRYSYTAAALSLLAPNTTLNYWDYQLRGSYDISPTQHLSLFAFGAYDYLGQIAERINPDTGETETKDRTIFGVEFHRLDLRYDTEVGPRTKLRQAFTLGLDRTALAGPEDPSTNRQSEGIYSQDILIGSRTRILHRLDENILLRGGIDATMDAYSIDAGADTGAQALFDILFPPRHDIAVGFYADAIIDAGRKVEFTPGARIDLWGSRGATELSADLRLAMGVPLTQRLRLTSAMGLAHQPPAFVLPVPGFAIGELSGGLQKSFQTATGLEAELPLSIKANATFFLNGFFNMNDVLNTAGGDGPDNNEDGPNGMNGNGMTGGGMNGPGPEPPKPADQGQGPDGDGAAVINQRALGNAIGMEIYLRRKLTEQLGGYISYTLSRSTRHFGTSSGVARFDRTHVLNGAISWEPGKGWRLGTRMVFYTGLPLEAETARQWGSDRTAPFFRIDGRIEKRWKLSKRGWISLVLEMLNASLSKEQTGIDCDGNGNCTPTEIGPVAVPSLGVEGGLN